MKRRFLSVLVIFSFICLCNSVCFAQSSVMQKQDHSQKVQKHVKKKSIAHLYNIAKFIADYETAANNYDEKAFLAMYSDNYLNNDGFDKSIIKKNISKTWSSYPAIKYKMKLNGVSFQGDKAILDMTETATGSARIENSNIADFTSTTQAVFYLEQKDDSWVIAGENTLKEKIILLWGDAKLASVSLDAPTQISAGKEYSAILSVIQPKDVVSIGSIVSDRVTYPIKNSKEIFRKFSMDGTIERVMKSNVVNTNEYIISTVGFTRPQLDDNKNLNVNLSGYACIMQRMNVIPINKFIEVKDEQTK